ncbi:UNVERIFIED_CONTAM: hypothetical protein PYX00_001217 [Menopon gallinae]|uniref:RING finger protein 207 n=1 Tax=Menopon gallinae TaxID=328185 RepID=A0AAW2IBX2_9NEOP
MFSTHDIVHMSKCSKEVQKRCPVHGELYIMFNNAQKSMLCVTCFRDTPNETRMHCVDIDAAYTQCSKKLDRAVISICEVQNSVRDGLLMFKSLLEELRHNMDCEKHTINTFCQGMQESIAKTHSNMIMEVQRQYETKERSFRGQIMNLGTLLPVIQLHLLLCQSFMNIANKYQFLDLAHPMIERLSAIGQLIQPQRPVQSSQIRTNYRNEFTQSLEPWIGKINQSINHAIPTQDTNIFDHIPAAPLPNPASHSGPSKRQQNALRTKALEGEGPFSNHCRSFDSQVKEISQQITLVKERLGDLHRDVALLRRAQTPPLMTRYQHITGDCTVLEEQIERHRVELERMKNVFETLWEEQLCRIHVEQDIFQSQMNEILNLLAEVKHLCIVAQKLEPYIKSLSTINVQGQPKTADQKLADNQQVQELNLHNQQLQSLLEHINSLQLDSQKFYSQSIISPTGSKNLSYTKGDGKDKESRSRPRTPSQSPGTMAAMLDQSGNVILYETQRTQQSTPSDGGEKRGVISQLFEKVRTKEDRKKSPEDRERSQAQRERGKSDTRSDIIRTKASTENVHEQSTQRQPGASTKTKGKKEPRYGRDGKVASIYQSISGRVLGSRSDHTSETSDLKQASRLPPPPPPARRAPSQELSTDIRERLESHLKEKLQDMLNKSNINKHISTRTEKSRSLDAETMEELSYQRISDALIRSPEERKATRAIVHREPSSRAGSTSTSPRRREEYRDQTRVRERSRERRDRRDRSRERSRESRDRSREEREKERERSKPREGRERSKERRERRDKYGRYYPASDTEDTAFYPGHIARKQNSCDSLTLSTVSVDSRKSSADLGDRKTLVLVIGSSKGSSKLKGVQKQRSWETFPPKRKSYDQDSYGRPYRDSNRFEYRPSSAQDGCRSIERGHASRDREREPAEGTLRKADSFEGHEEAVRTLVAAVHQTRTQQQQQQSRKVRTGGNVSN